MTRISLTRPLMAGAFVCAFYAALSPAQAQEPSAAAVTSARELVAIRGGANMFDTVVSGVIEQGKALFLQMNPALSKDLNEVATKLRGDLLSRRSELEIEVARVYAQRFTAQEINDAIAFYKTPLGKKIVAEEPVIIDQSFARIQQWANKLSEEVLNGYRAEMKKKGHNL